MIELDIKPYCENCLVFEPDVTAPVKPYGESLTYIRCERRGLCAGLVKYLEKEIRKSAIESANKIIENQEVKHD